MVTRREFLWSSGIFGGTVLLGGATLLRACGDDRDDGPPDTNPPHVVPETIDNTGTRNVSAALTDWLATTGRPGDAFALRPRPDGSPGRYRVPQGVRIGKSMMFDLAGCALLTGRTLGADDARFEANRKRYPALWDDWGEQSEPDFEFNGNGRTWPKHRVVLLVAASDVLVTSSRPGARIQGAARTVRYRSPGVRGRRLSTGCNDEPTLEMQHGIRIGGRPGAHSDANSYRNIVLDLDRISVEFVHGDGVYLGDNHHHIRILGHNLGEPVLGGSTHVDDRAIQGHTGQGGDIIEGGTIDDDRWKPWAEPLPGIHHTGRHGIATDFRNYDTLIEGVAIWRTGRAVIDWEPSASFAEIVGPVIRGIEVGIHTLLFMPCAGPRPIRDLVCEDVVHYEAPTIGTVQPDATHRHANWIIRNNRCVSGVTQRGSPLFELPRIDGLHILDNHARVERAVPSVVTDTGGTGANGPSTAVVIDPGVEVQFGHPR